MKIIPQCIKNHHPYCQELYKEYQKGNWLSWDCRCGTLKGYDEWRKQVSAPSREGVGE